MIQGKFLTILFYILAIVILDVVVDYYYGFSVLYGGSNVFFAPTYGQVRSETHDTNHGDLGDSSTHQ